MNNLNQTLTELTRKAGSVRGAIKVWKGTSQTGNTQYRIISTYARCSRIEWWIKKFAFWIATKELKRDWRIEVKTTFTCDTYYTDCDYGKRHQSKVFDATLSIETHDLTALSELEDFEKAIRNYYYACSEVKHELAPI